MSKFKTIKRNKVKIQKLVLHVKYLLGKNNFAEIKILHQKKSDYYIIITLGKHSYRISLLSYKK